MFTNSQTQGDFSGSQASPGSAPKNANTMMPVTAQMIIESSEMNGRQQKFETQSGLVLSVVCVVAQVSQEPVVRSTKTEYQLSDGTAELKAVDWNGEANSVSDVIHQNDWVRVYGKVQSMGDNRQLSVFKIRKVIDPEEKRYHQLQMIYSAMKLGKLGDSGVASSVNHAAASSSSAAAFGGQQQQQQQQQQQGVHMFGGGDSDEPEFETEVQKCTYALFAADQSEGGRNILDVVQELASRFDANQVKEAVTYLSDEGLVFSTHDDEHFKATN